MCVLESCGKPRQLREHLHCTNIEEHQIRDTDAQKFNELACTCRDEVGILEVTSTSCPYGGERLVLDARRL